LNKVFEQDYTDLGINKILLCELILFIRQEVAAYSKPSSPKTTEASHSLSESEFGLPSKTSQSY